MSPSACQTDRGPVLIERSVLAADERRYWRDWGSQSLAPRHNHLAGHGQSPCWQARSGLCWRRRCAPEACAANGVSAPIASPPFAHLVVDPPYPFRSMTSCSPARVPPTTIAKF